MRPCQPAVYIHFRTGPYPFKTQKHTLSYSFTLKHEANEEQSLAEKEELYRLAEREVNAYVTRFEKAKYEGFSTQDCLAMAALQLAISSASLARSREVGSEDLRRLEALRDEIDEYLNRIETEKK